MARFELKLPKMGESVAEATIINWLKSVGDTVEVDEGVLEVATDKVDSEVSSEARGVLIEKLFENDDIIQVGDTIAIIETEEVETEKVETVEVVPEEKIDRDIQKVQETNEIVKKVEYFSDSNRFYSPLVKNIAEEEGITSEELKIMNGTGKEGRITKNDILAYVKNKKSFVPEFLDQRLGVIDENEISNLSEVAEPLSAKPDYEKEISISEVMESVSEKLDYEKDTSISEMIESVSEKLDFEKEINISEVMESVSVPEKSDSEKKQYSSEISELSDEEPKIKEVSNLQDVSLLKIEVPGSEKELISKEKKTLFKEAPSSTIAEKVSVSVNGVDEIVEMDRMGKIVAHHMVQSVQTSVHVQSFIEADVTNIWKWREKNKKAFENREGEKLTLTPIFMEAIVKAIKDFPLINISVESNSIIKKKNINLGMAVALPSGNLIVPVIKNADQLNLLGMAKAVNDLASRARDNKLKPDDTQGGTYTVTNIGTFGTIFGTPVINQPQVAILALGAIRKVPAVVETPEGDFIAIRHKIFLSHSYDHRVVNGELGGKFIQRVAKYLEEFDIDRDL